MKLVVLDSRSRCCCRLKLTTHPPEPEVGGFENQVPGGCCGAMGNNLTRRLLQLCRSVTMSNADFLVLMNSMAATISGTSIWFLDRVEDPEA